MSNFIEQLHCFVGSPRYDRLANEINEYKVELERRIKCAQQAQQVDFYWTDSASELMEEAEQALKQSDSEKGWRCLQAAKCMEILGYDEKERKNKIFIIRREAEKLGSWRRNAIYDLIGKPGDQRGVRVSSIDNRRLYRAAQIINEHYSNQYFRIALRRRNLRILFLILVITIIAIPIMSGFGVLPNIGVLPKKFADYKIFLMVELFGVLGATFSVALTLTKRAITEKIVDQIMGSFITWMRPAIGAAAALAAYIFLQAGFLQEILNENMKESIPAILAVAFIAGFSERLIISTISKVSPPEEKEAKTSGK